MAIGSDSIPVISHYDSTNGDLRVTRCTAVACAVGTSASLDTVGLVGVDNVGHDRSRRMPVVAYYDSTNGDLKVARCTNRFCIPYVRQR